MEVSSSFIDTFLRSKVHQCTTDAILIYKVFYMHLTETFYD
jgi:hypothetical protein